MWRNLIHYWGRDESLTAFLWLLILFIFVIAPLSHGAPIFELIVGTIFGLVLIAGLLASVGSPSLAYAAVACIMLAVGTAILKSFGFGSPPLLLISQLSGMAVVGLLLYVLTHQVMRDGPVTSHRLKGGIAVYMLIGLFWAKLYHVVELIIPQSFSGINAEQVFPSFVYFSFVTLTTIGYGDILPVSDIARAMATAEGFLGQLFPAIFIARLVTPAASNRK